jgi:hypothetical protein
MKRRGRRRSSAMSGSTIGNGPRRRAIPPFGANVQIAAKNMSVRTSYFDTVERIMVGSRRRKLRWLKIDAQIVTH